MCTRVSSFHWPEIKKKMLVFTRKKQLKLSLNNRPIGNINNHRSSLFSSLLLQEVLQKLHNILREMAWTAFSQPSCSCNLLKGTLYCPTSVSQPSKLSQMEGCFGWTVNRTQCVRPSLERYRGRNKYLICCQCCEFAH